MNLTALLRSQHLEQSKYDAQRSKCQGVTAVQKSGQLHRYIDLDGRHEVAGERVACAGLSERTGQTIGYP